MASLKKVLLKGVALKIATGLFIILLIILMRQREIAGRIGYAVIFIMATWIMFSYCGKIKESGEKSFYLPVVIACLFLIAFKSFWAMLLYR